MNKIVQYYSSGLATSTFKTGELLNLLNSALLDLYKSDELPKDFMWEEKYPNTKDLRPNVFDLNPVFLDILFENNIPDLLNQTVGTNLTLSHIQIRKSSKGPSYMDWHRDSYIVDGNIIGNMPPVHKIIFYPQVTSAPEEKLLVLKGSNLCILNQPSTNYLSPGFSTIDRQLFQNLECVSYTSSVNEFVLFNTSALHAVVPDTNDAGSIRVIYSFVHPLLYSEKYAQKDIHNRLNKEYEKRKGVW